MIRTATSSTCRYRYFVCTLDEWWQKLCPANKCVEARRGRRGRRLRQRRRIDFRITCRQLNPPACVRSGPTVSVAYQVHTAVDCQGADLQEHAATSKKAILAEKEEKYGNIIMLARERDQSAHGAAAVKPPATSARAREVPTATPHSPMREEHDRLDCVSRSRQVRPEVDHAPSLVDEVLLALRQR